MAYTFTSHVPVYEQIVELIRGSIAAGECRSGEALPSIRGLATDLAVNPNTVQRAYRELERQGLAETRRGLGVFVTGNGPVAARVQLEAAVQQRFVESIERGRTAGLSAQHIRTVFYRAMSQIQTGTSNGEGVSDLQV